GRGSRVSAGGAPPTLGAGPGRRCRAAHYDRTAEPGGRSAVRGVSHPADGREGARQQAVSSLGRQVELARERNGFAGTRPKPGTKYPFRRLCLTGRVRHLLWAARVPGRVVAADV